MFDRNIHAVALLLIGTAAVTVCEAQNVDFDRYPNGTAVANNTVITTQYQALGVTFSSPAPGGGPTAGAFSGEASSSPHYLVGYHPPSQAGLHAIEMAFAAPYTDRVDVTLISVGGGTVTATAYASDLVTVLDSVSLTHGPNAGNGLGNQDRVSLAATGIALVRFAIEQTGPVLDGFGIDDVSFTLAPGEPFAAFAPKADIKLVTSLGQDSVIAKGTFELSPSSNGINPLAEDVMVAVAQFSRLIPGGAFQPDGSGGVKFSGNVGGATLTVKITAPVNGIYSFTIAGKKTNLQAATFPVTVALRIGDDAGLAVLANIKLSASQ